MVGSRVPEGGDVREICGPPEGGHLRAGCRAQGSVHALRPLHRVPLPGAAR